MRTAVVGLLLLGLAALVPAAGFTQADRSATPQAATPVQTSVTGALATRVAQLEATVASQTVAQIEAELRIDELEQGLAPLLESLPEEALVISFLQSQIDDLRARVDELEAAASATPVAADHPLVGTWAVVDETTDGVPGLVAFTPDGAVVAISPGEGTGIGAWAATGPRSAIAVWVFPRAGDGEQRAVTALQVRITVDAGDASITMAYQVMGVASRGSVSERESGTITGVRVPLRTATPIPDNGDS